MTQQAPRRADRSTGHPAQPFSASGTGLCRSGAFFSWVLMLGLAAMPLRATTEIAEPLSKASGLINAAVRQVEDIFPGASRLSSEDVAHAAINGILHTIDPSGLSYVFSDSGKVQEASPARPGFLVRLHDAVPTVTSLIPQSQAYLEDIRTGDVLLRVDGRSVVGRTLHEIDSLLEGDDASEVELAFYRPDSSQFFSIETVRQPIEPAVVGRSIGHGVGYLQVSRLGPDTAAHLEQKIAALSESDLIGLVLDLRNTSGGAVEDAVGVVGVFAASVPVVQVQKNGTEVTTLATGEGQPVTLPLVVLTNRGTTGAAEVVAGALKDDRRAVVVGEATFGLGSTQTDVNLSPGEILRLTSALYLSPSGRAIASEGVTPDIPVEGPGAKLSPQVYRDLHWQFVQFVRGERPSPRPAPSAKDSSDSASGGDDAGQEGDEDGETGGGRDSSSSGAVEEAPASKDEDLPEGHPDLDTGDEGAGGAASGKPGSEEAGFEGNLDSYGLVKKHDHQLTRSVNLLISASIFFQYEQDGRK